MSKVMGWIEPIGNKLHPPSADNDNSQMSEKQMHRESFQKFTLIKESNWNYGALGYNLFDA